MNHLENSITSGYTISHALTTLESLSTNLVKALDRKDFGCDVEIELKYALDEAISATKKARDLMVK